MLLRFYKQCVYYNDRYMYKDSTFFLNICPNITKAIYLFVIHCLFCNSMFILLVILDAIR